MLNLIKEVWQLHSRVSTPRRSCQAPDLTLQTPTSFSYACISQFLRAGHTRNDCDKGCNHRVVIEVHKLCARTLVSGQEQQIFLGFPSGPIGPDGVAEGGGEGADCCWGLLSLLPIVTNIL